MNETTFPSIPDDSRPLPNDDWDDMLLNAAYSSIGVAPINTLEHFITAAHLGFNALKCDLRLTKDGELVLCHDAGVTLDADGRITKFDRENHILLHDLTLAQCEALEHAASPYDMGHRAHMCRFDNYLSVCKRFGMIPYVTLRNEYVPETVAAVLKKLKRHGLYNRTVINGFSAMPVLEYIRTLDRHIKMIYVLPKNHPLTVDIVKQAEALGRCTVCLFVSDVDAAFYDECAPAFAYAHERDIKVGTCQVADAGKYTAYVEEGYSNFQIIRPFLPYARKAFDFVLHVSDGKAELTGPIAGTAPYTASLDVTENGIEMRDIYLNGSSFRFADGLPALWMNLLPYSLQVSADSGIPCRAEWKDNRFLIHCSLREKDDCLRLHVEV